MEQLIVLMCGGAIGVGITFVGLFVVVTFFGEDIPDEGDLEE